MANRTLKDAHSIKGTNPQYLVEKIIRMRIYDSKFWKEECFAISADLLVDKGMELRYVGGIYGGNVKPTPFLCLILKMLQIQPDKDIIIEFIRQEEFKYIRALGAMYMRLTGTSIEVYKYLEPLYNDYRKLRWMSNDSSAFHTPLYFVEFEVIHLDEFVDKLLKEERVCDIQLPRLQRRYHLEESGELEPRVSALEEDLDNISSSDEEEDKAVSKKRSSPDVPRRRSRSPPGARRRSRSKERRRSRSHSREREKHRTADRDRKGDSRDTKRGGDARKRTRADSYDREIQEANELRAKCGLPPLEQ